MSDDTGLRRLRPHFVGIAIVGIAIGAVIGGLLGFYWRGGWTADWVGAAGTWIGSAGTIATIAWAIIAFRHERREERTARAKQNEEAKARVVRTADQVLFRAFVSGRAGGFKRTVSLEIDNATTRPIEIRGVDVVVSEAGFNERRINTPVLVESGGSWSPSHFARIDVVFPEDHDFARKVHLTECILHYRLDGVEWSRTPDTKPIRVDL